MIFSRSLLLFKGDLAFTLFRYVKHNTIQYTILHYTTLYYTLVCSTQLYSTLLYYTILYYTILYYTNYAILYFIPCLEKYSQSEARITLHILRYATGNMQRVVFHSTFPSFLPRNSLLGSIWGLLKSELQNLSTPANHYEHLRSHPEIVYEDFRTLSKTSGRFSENFKKS